jgi:hypothetical protein
MAEELQQARKVKYHTKDVTIPQTGLVVRKDHYWLCEDGDPAKALFHNTTPQCNSDKRCTEWVLNNAYKSHNNIQIVFIDIAFIPQIY